MPGYEYGTMLEDVEMQGREETEPKECCDEWLPQSEKVNGPIMLQAIRSGQPGLYDGIPFRYCPWCGTKRPEEFG